MEENKINRKIALLIDAENISNQYILSIFDELSKYGTVTYKRIYGDWTSPNMTKWKNVIQENALSPIQQFQNTQNKNSSDSALIIDAMDILYSHFVDSFCIVSSDSDFTRLITRIREDGLFVIGMGEKKTAKSLVRVCDKFVYLDIIGDSEKEEEKEVKPRAKSTGKEPSKSVEPKVKNVRKQSKKRPLERDKVVATMKIIDELSQEDGFANFADVINRLSKLYPDMDSANYGYAKSSDLFSTSEAFVMKKVQLNSTMQVFIKVNE